MVLGMGRKTEAPAPEPPVQDLAPTGEQALDPMADLLEQSAGLGTEGDLGSFAPAFLQIIQANSPQLKPAQAEYIEEAKIGMIMNSATGEIYPHDEGVKVVAIAMDRVFIEWMDRDHGAGFVGIHQTDSEKVRRNSGEKNRDGAALKVLSDGEFAGHILMDTRQHYLLLLSGMTPMPCMLGMSSTQIKKSRKWMTRIDREAPITGRSGDQFKAPAWTRVYQLTSGPESNDKGDWYGWIITPLDKNEDAKVAVAAAEFYKQIKAGDVGVVIPESEAAQPGQQGATDDDIPF
tara:strand:+ start:5902 stop:6771 length:870 start_codon:yes stop_codon:yes gene_type:complete